MTSWIEGGLHGIAYRVNAWHVRRRETGAERDRSVRGTDSADRRLKAPKHLLPDQRGKFRRNRAQWIVLVHHDHPSCLKRGLHHRLLVDRRSRPQIDDMARNAFV